LIWINVTRDYKFVNIEQTYEDIKPDAMIEIDGRLVFIEVAHTHFIDQNKLEKLKRIGIETWEINLKGLDAFDTYEFTKSILKDTHLKNGMVYEQSNYYDELNYDCSCFREQADLIYDEDDFDYRIQYPLLYKKLLYQYTNKVKLGDSFSQFYNKYPIHTGSNLFRIVDTQANMEYWINVLHYGIDSQYGEEFDTEAKLILNNQDFLFEYYSFHNPNQVESKYSNQLCTPFWATEVKFTNQLVDKKDLSFHDLLMKNRINLKSNVYNDRFMLYGAYSI
jgi:hypothetical protein